MLRRILFRLSFEKQNLSHFHSSQPLSKDGMNSFPNSQHFQSKAVPVPIKTAAMTSAICHQHSERTSYTMYKGESLQQQEAAPAQHYPRTWKLSGEKAEITKLGGLPCGTSRLLRGSPVPQHALCTWLNMLFLPPYSWAGSQLPCSRLSHQAACSLLFLPRLLSQAVHTSLLSHQRQPTPDLFLVAKQSALPDDS